MEIQFFITTTDIAIV